MIKLIQVRPELMNKKLKISIFIIFISLAGFLFFYNYSSAQQCDLTQVIFNPGGTQSQTWFRRADRASFTVTLQGNGNCGGKTLNNVALVNTPGTNNDIEALNDEPVTFNQGSNRIVFTFIAGEEGCDAFPGRNDCQLRLNVQSDVGDFWSDQISGSPGGLNYECDNRFGWCDENVTFQLSGIQGGRVGTPTVTNSICAYVAPDNKYACINNSNQSASQGRCNQVPECQNRNCLVINPSACSQLAGGGQVPPGGGQVPGQPQTIGFNIPNPIAAESLVDLAKAIGRFLFQIAIPIAVIIIIYAGLLFLTSRGNEKQITQAKQALLYAVVGLAIILIGQGFFTLIKSILNLGSPGQ